MTNAMPKPKKSLGQNFLIDESVLKDIASAVAPKQKQIVVEIGPGHGELTKYLLESGAKIVAIEKDRELASRLASMKYEVSSIKYKNLEIIQEDALKILPILHTKYLIPNTKYKLVGNIPYYITGYLFRVIQEIENKPSLIVFTIQKEVAERICAQPGKTNLLSASIQVWARPEIVRIVDRTSFNPRPKVDSAIVRLKTHDKKRMTTEESKKYYNLLHVLFKQPRKTVLNNLREGLYSLAPGRTIETIKIEVLLEKAGINPKLRPQDLSVEDILRLSSAI